MLSLQRCIKIGSRYFDTVINRTAVRVSPDKSMKTAEDYLEVNEVFWVVMTWSDVALSFSNIVFYP